MIFGRKSRSFVRCLSNSNLTNPYGSDNVCFGNPYGSDNVVGSDNVCFGNAFLGQSLISCIHLQRSLMNKVCHIWNFSVKPN